MMITMMGVMIAMMMKFVIWHCEIIVEFHWAISDVCDFNDPHWKSSVFSEQRIAFSVLCNALVVFHCCAVTWMGIVKSGIGTIVCDTARLINQQRWVGIRNTNS